MKSMFLFLSLSFSCLFIACTSAPEASTEKTSDLVTDIPDRSAVEGHGETKNSEIAQKKAAARVDATLAESAGQAVQSQAVVKKEMPKAFRKEKKSTVVNTSKPVEASLKTEVAKAKLVPVAEAEGKVEKIVEKANTVLEKTITPVTKVNKEPKIEETPPPPPPAPKVSSLLSHAPFDALLKKYVSSSGKVNYKGFKGDASALNAYIASLSENTIKDSWSRSEKMAYWINAYNAHTIKLIIDNYPLKSITDLEGGKPWDKRWIKLGGKTYSLNDIENKILRPQFKEPGIHFAVNCAAKSCPPLLNRAWTGKNLNSNFKKQTTAFVNNSKFNQIGNNGIKISKIFDWYKVDFGDLIGYLNGFSNTKIDKGAKVEYLEYDWGLNE